MKLRSSYELACADGNGMQEWCSVESKVGMKNAQRATRPATVGRGELESWRVESRVENGEWRMENGKFATGEVDYKKESAGRGVSQR